MSWKMSGHEWPKEGELVLVFRSKRKKYVPAYFRTLHDIEEGDKQCWVTQQNCAHDVQSDDAWMVFEYYKTEQEWK